MTKNITENIPQQNKDILVEVVVESFLRNNASRQTICWLMQAGIVKFDNEKHKYVLVQGEINAH